MIKPTSHRRARDRRLDDIILYRARQAASIMVEGDTLATAAVRARTEQSRRRLVAKVDATAPRFDAAIEQMVIAHRLQQGAAS